MRYNFDSEQPTLLDIEVGQAPDEVTVTYRGQKNIVEIRMLKFLKGTVSRELKGVKKGNRSKVLFNGS